MNQNEWPITNRGFRTIKVDGVRPPYRKGGIKINQRRLKRLKNKLWRMCKRSNQFVSRIQTHLSDDKFSVPYPQVANTQNEKRILREWSILNMYSEDFKIYEDFYQKWHKYKQANLELLSGILKSKQVNVNSIYKLMNKTEVNA